MTPSRDPTAAADAVLRALCWPLSPDQSHPVDWPVRDWRAGLGELIECAILHKVLCLLADRVAATGLDRDLPRPISRFLAGALRANQHKTHIYRAEIARIMVPVGAAGVSAAAVNGIAAESHLYHGSGARQFSDLDLLLAPEDIMVTRTVLTELGYHSHSLTAMTYTRHLDDMLVPRITLDVSHSLHHTTSHDDIHEILNRRVWQPLPGHDQLLPVLAAPDALLHCLARLDRSALTPPRAGVPRWALCADALRLAHVCRNLPAAHLDPPPQLPVDAAAGWARLRDIWPALHPTPFRAPSSGVSAVAGDQR